MTNLERLRSLPEDGLAPILCAVLLLLIACAMTVLASEAHAQTFNVIHRFSGPDGSHPQAGVTRSGIRQGTTSCLGECGGAGSVFQIRHLGSSWAYKTIPLFSAGGMARRQE